MTIRYKNEGFIFFPLLALILVFFSTLLAYFFYAHHLELYDKNTDICRIEFLNQQKRTQTTLQNLLVLNPKALALFKERKRAEKMLLEALRTGNPKAIAAASAYLALVISKQTSLDLIQKKLIYSVYLDRLKTSLEVKNKIIKSESELNFKINFLAKKIPKLELVRTLPSDLAPTYQPVPQFTDTQKLQLNWKTESSLKTFSSQFWKKLKFKGKSGCIVSLIPDQSYWKPALIEDKFF